MQSTPPANSPLRIILADDHQIFRQGLRALIAEHRDMSVVGEASDGRTAVRLASECQADVLIMDVSMPDLNGIEATRQLLAAHPSMRVIALSAHSDRRFVAEMLKAGARGYLLKEGAFEELAAAIRSVASNHVFLSPGVAHLVLDDYLNGSIDNGPAVLGKLSPREREVLQLLAEGNATKEIARKLHVSVKTIETHRRQIMVKLDTHSVAELTKLAVREGLTSL